MHTKRFHHHHDGKLRVRIMKGIPHDEKYHDRIMKDQNHGGKMMIHQEKLDYNNS